MLFTESFKYYKRKCPSPDLSQVINPDNIEFNFKLVNKNVINKYVPEKANASVGIIPSEFWQIYELKDHPGLIIIRNPFTNYGQRYWIAKSLRDYPRKPHHVNITSKQFPDEIINDWWHALQNIDDPLEHLKLKNALRWTTLGYHHDWDSKIYDENKKHHFPEDLHNLTSVFASSLGYKDFKSQAAIINYYPQGSTLSGHTDHSEVNLDAPLFSISFGQSAIFLIGGPTKDCKTSAILVQSGDVVVMSKESRLCYHAVPKILKNSFSEVWHCSEEHLDDLNVPTSASLTSSMVIDTTMDVDLWISCLDNKFWIPYNDYLTDCRININIRQVLRDDQTCL